MSSTDFSYIDAEKVRSILNWPLVTAAVEAALIAVGNDHASNGGADAGANTSYANQAARSITRVQDQHDKLLLTMPAFVGNYEINKGMGLRSDKSDHLKQNTLACKLVTSFGSNSACTPPLPKIMANIMLFNVNTGRLQVVIEGTDITTWRTAAASVVATCHLYFRRRYPDESTPEHTHDIDVGIVGCGVQGAIHAEAMCFHFSVRTIRLWNRTAQRALDLSKSLQAKYPKVNVEVAETPAAAVHGVNVICIATYASEALIKYADISASPYLHINTVGAGQVHFGEVAQDIYDHSVVYVDSMVNARHELKDLKANIIGEVGELIVKGKYPEKNSYTIFQSMGMATEDACVAQAVYNKIQEMPSH